jgi:hypothetical protein
MTIDGTFTGTASVDYRLSFADQGKQVSVFRLQRTNGVAILISIYIHIYINIYLSVYIYIYIYIYIYMLPFQTQNGSPGDFP